MTNNDLKSESADYLSKKIKDSSKALRDAIKKAKEVGKVVGGQDQSLINSFMLKAQQAMRDESLEQVEDLEDKIEKIKQKHNGC